MQTLQAIITGFVQGLSEFLPISSSAHIVFSNEIYNLVNGYTEINHQEEIFFDIMVHLATLLAILLYFFSDIKDIISKSVLALKNKEYSNRELKLLGFIILSAIITGLIGMILKNPVEKIVENPQTICFFLIITGAILLFSEKMYKGTKDINLKSTIFIAIAQGLAIFPGFSRSGFTIAAGLLSGMKRTESARFSFLMSIPVILMASFVYPLLEIDWTEFSNFNLKAIIMGFFVSFIVGFFCIKYFMRLLAKLSLKIFGYYCFVAAPLMWVLFQFFYHH